MKPLWKINIICEMDIHLQLFCLHDVQIQFEMLLIRLNCISASGSLLFMRLSDQGMNHNLLVLTSVVQDLLWDRKADISLLNMSKI